MTRVGTPIRHPKKRKIPPGPPKNKAFSANLYALVTVTMSGPIFDDASDLVAPSKALK